MAGTRDADGGWVLAGPEAPPVETVGPERDEGPEGPEQPQEPSARDAEPSARDAEPSARDAAPPSEQDAACATPTGGSTEGVEEGPEPAEQEAAPGLDGSSPATCAPEEPAVEPGPDVPRAAPSAEEGSGTSSDDDLEGLRRRQGQEPRLAPTPPAPAPRWGAPRDTGDEEGGSGSKYLLGALALVAVGLLLVSGGIYDPAEGPAESVVTRDVAEGEQEPPVPTDVTELPPAEAETPPSLQSMSLLLDRLAKENQDIRLMQAQLQAHKEELQALLRRSEDEAAAAGAQHRSLEAENERLRAALEREAAALRAARDDLQRLRAHPQPEQPSKPAAAPASLAAARQELVGALERARASGDLERLLEELGSLEQRLEQVEVAEPFPAPWKKPFKGDKESKRLKRQDAAEKREPGKAQGHSKEPRPPRETKAWPKASPQPGPRELPPLSRYRAPPGCSGVADCARKEGMEPVQRAQFLQLLQGFMERLGWGRHFAGMAARLDGAFGPDGTFAHDRLRFVDFMDDAEELLEDLAQREGGDEEAADGFEEFVLQRVASDGGFAKKQRPRKGPQQHRGVRPVWGHESRSRG